MIKFITEGETDSKPTFGDVEQNQFFVDIQGDLCQRTATDVAVTIAGNDGRPYSCIEENIVESRLVNKIFPRVTKIEF